MPQQQSPFLEGKYGWNYGESGWNTGMDENLLKFSFMFDKNVDGIVSSLPAAINGRSYFLTTDNRLYFAVGSTWYSSPTPKWFEFKIRSTGDVYQFNGTAAVQIESPAGVDARLDAVELTVASLGSAAFEDVSFFATQSGLDVVEANAQAYTDAATQPLVQKLTGVKALTEFGVVGDGITDDTAAMALATAYNGHVVGDSSLVVMVDSFTVTGSVKLDMRGGMVKQRSALTRITINAQDVEFHNTVFDGDNLNVDVCFFRIPTTYNGWRFERCTFQNITGISGSANQYGIYADLDGAVGYVANCNFKNISNVSDGTPTSAFCGAMLLSAGASGCTDVRLENITINDVFCTGIAGNVNNSDADGIRVFGPQPTVQSNLQIRNVTCINVQKSGIKVSGNRGLVVSDITVYNDRSDVGMVAGVRFQAADYSQISNVNLVGRMAVGINIRSRNIIVDGVNFRPIDTARDTVAGGLIQFQSDDTYVTQHVTVSNVIGQNVAQAFDFDLTGVTIATAFQFIELHHWDVFATSGLSSGSSSRIQKANHVNLDHVKLWDTDGAWVNAFTCNGVSNLKFHYCRIECRREVATWAVGDNGIDFDGCSFFRPDAFSTENFRMLLLRDTSNGELDRVTVRNCTFSCPAYSTGGNQQCIFMRATNGVIDGVTIYVRVPGSDVSPPSGWVGIQGSGYKVSNIKVSSQSALTNGGGGYAVDISTLATGSVVTDVMNNSGPGVRASAGGNNNLIDTVAGKVTAVANSGTGNTVGSTHVLP